MARTPREAIVMVLDVGESVAKQKCENGKTFLENSCACISMIVQRKLFNGKRDLLSLFLLGSETTDNSLDYPDIELKYPMATASWNMLEYVEKRVQSTKKSSDWLNSVIVAMQYLKDETDGSICPISSKKLLLFTNLSADVSDEEDDVGHVINGLKSLEVEFFVIGPQLTCPDPTAQPTNENGHGADLQGSPADLKPPKSEQVQIGETFISRILKVVTGTVATFSEAVPQLQYFETRLIKPAPWNTILDVGPDIKIAVTGYKKISEATLPSWRVFNNNAESGLVERDRSHFKQDAEQTRVDDTEIVSGYMFGSTIVPFSGVDESTMQYQSGPRCLSIVGFTKASYIKRQMLVGDGLNYIVAQRDDEPASVALSALIHALRNKKMAAVARKVYNTNNAPVMGALLPKVRDDYECLMFVELPYCEDLRQYLFPSLRASKPSVAQLACVDKLIDNMDLMAANVDEEGDVCEAFHMKHSLNPYHQRFFQAMCDRGLNPDGPLPPVPQTILDLLVSPYHQDPAVEAALSDVAKHFPLVEIVRKEVRKTAAEVFNRDASDEPAIATAATATAATTMAAITSTTVVQIGSVDPVGDFNALLATGQSFNTVGKELCDRIIDIVLRSFGSDDFKKAAGALSSLRNKCVSNNKPAVYNDGIAELKHRVVARGKKPFWEHVTRDSLGLITGEECPLSCIDTALAADFLVLPEDKVRPSDDHDKMDVDDLLNDM